GPLPSPRGRGHFAIPARSHQQSAISGLHATSPQRRSVSPRKSFSPVKLRSREFDKDLSANPAFAEPALRSRHVLDCKDLRDNDPYHSAVDHIDDVTEMIAIWHRHEASSEGTVRICLGLIRNFKR